MDYYCGSVSTALQRIFSARRCLSWVVAWCAASLVPALACEGSQRIRLLQPVALSAKEQAEFRAMAPLRVVAVDAPPMTRYDPSSQTYAGIGVDAWCFIAGQLGLRYEIAPGRDLTTADKILQVQESRADAFLSLSFQAERAQRGTFTLPYYETYYAIIARKGRRLPVNGLDELTPYRVGVIKGVALEPRLHSLLPASQLTIFDALDSDGLFQAVRQGTLDVAVFNKGIFEEKRFAHEYFDLEVVHTLRDNPRGYSFYFSPTPQNQRIAAAFDRYLAAMDLSESVAMHEQGERQLIERYVAQRSQRTLLLAASVAATILVLLFGLALLRYRRLTRLLAESNQQILQQKQALQAANQRLEHLSLSDGLTGLSNRRAFDEALQREHARWRRTGASLSVLIVDVDHFKWVNDHYGHSTGDDYLRAIAQVLRKSVARPTDLTARYGGEEFACLLPDTDTADAQALAERVREATVRLALPNARAPGQQLTVSIGVATTDVADATAQDMMARADAQLYAAKRAGRNRVHAAVARRA